MRFRLSELGKARNPEQAAKIGTVLRRARIQNQLVVLFDGHDADHIPPNLHRAASSCEQLNRSTMEIAEGRLRHIDHFRHMRVRYGTPQESVRCCRSCTIAKTWHRRQLAIVGIVQAK